MVEIKAFNCGYRDGIDRRSFIKDGISIRGQVPRKIGERIYKDRNITIRNNILAYSRKAQFGLMRDQDFMGRHPSERDLREEEWKKRLQDAVNPDSIGLILDYNLYAIKDDTEIVRWGVDWRPKWKPYTDLDSFIKKRGLERHVKIAKTGFVSLQERDFRLISDSPAISVDDYICYGIRYPVL